MNIRTYLKPSRTYKTEARAMEEAEKFTLIEGPHDTTLRYMVIEQHGRFFPVFIGQEALRAGVQFTHTVVG